MNRKEQTMAQAKNGDTVNVHYTGKLKDGTIFDSSADREPLEFTIGEGQIIPGFEQGVVGMEPGETKTVNIPADKAYGLHRKELVLVVDKSRIPAHLKPEVGRQLKLNQPGGQAVPVRVTGVSESKVTVDANQPLAGKDLTFDVQLVEIV
jgi:peptidylprolyl isomerase